MTAVDRREDETTIEDTALEGSEILTLDQFEVPVPMSEERKREYSRRFLTLFMPADQPIHRGGSGCVYKVTNANGEVFALKRILHEPKHPLVDDEQYARDLKAQKDAFRKEYENQQRLSSFKGFPKLYGYGYLAGEPIILMEWVEGQTLSAARSTLARGQTPAQAAPMVVAELGIELFALLARMDYLEESFVHRDISPNNIMLRTSRRSIAEQRDQEDYDLCLIDFGSSSPVSTGVSFTVATNVLRKATPEYAPPEMLSSDLNNIEKKRKSPSIDVYAVCSVLYELLAAKTPYRLSKQSDMQSFYRFKVDYEIPFPGNVHRTRGDMSVFLDDDALREIPGRLATSTKPLDEHLLLKSLLEIDDQLALIIMQGLTVEQESRPSAAEMRDMMMNFKKNYISNIEAYYRGERVAPFKTSGTSKVVTRRPDLQPIPLFVTGTVLRPGEYAVTLSSDATIARMQGQTDATGRRQRPPLSTSKIALVGGTGWAAAIVAAWLCLAGTGTLAFTFDAFGWVTRSAMPLIVGVFLMSVPALIGALFGGTGRTPGARLLSQSLASIISALPIAGFLALAEWDTATDAALLGGALLLAVLMCCIAGICLWRLGCGQDGRG